MERPPHVLFAALTILALAPAAHATPPRTTNFQGRLSDASGTPLEGVYQIRFAFWNAAAGGVKCFEETKMVAVSGGLFSAIIGDATSGGISVTCDFGNPQYIALQVGADSPMAPRLAVTATAYALGADEWQGRDSTELVQQDGTGKVVVTGSLGVGTAAPAQGVEVAGTAGASVSLCIGAVCKTSWPGTVSQIAGGTGIVVAPNPITSTGTISVDTAMFQRRVSATCAGGGIRTIADGTVTCTPVPPGPVSCQWKNRSYSDGARCRSGLARASGSNYDFQQMQCNSGTWAASTMITQPVAPVLCGT